MKILHANIIKEALDNKDKNKIRKILNNADAPDIAILIDQLSDKHKIMLYLLLPTLIASEVLLEVSQHSRKFILKSLKDKYIISMIKTAESDDSVDILNEMPQHKVKRIFELLPRKKKEAIEPLIKYEEDTAGGLMQSELISLPGSLKVKEAVKEIKKKSTDIEGFSYLYITDSKDKLKGVVSIHELITAQDQKKLSQIMKKEVVKVYPDIDKEKVAQIFMNEDIFAVPVVDKQGKLLGRVTVDDVLDVMEEEATEDMFKIAGVNPDESVFDPVRKVMGKRLLWLVINLGTAIFAALTISLFQDTIQAAVILAAFMPIVAGMGGNAGTQTLTLVVRAIALEQIMYNNWKKVLFKEVLLGLINGTITGLIMMGIVYLWTHNIMIGVVILLAMMINLVVAGLIGSAVPLLLKAFKVDPAVASSVFLTTFTDVVGFFSFLGIASLLMQWIV